MPRKESLASQIYPLIRREIITCRLLPGQPINESELIRRYNVSKTPVREALKQLTQEGLIQSIPGACYLVTSITLRDVVELFDMRAILEEAIALRVVEQITDHQIDELEKLIGEEFPLQTVEDQARWYDMNLEFHLAMARITKNERLEQSLRKTLEEVSRFLIIDKEHYSRTDELVAHHRKIIAALRARDGALAARITLEDIEISLPRIQQLAHISPS